jgi:thermitase
MRRRTVQRSAAAVVCAALAVSLLASRSAAVDDVAARVAAIWAARPSASTPFVAVGVSESGHPVVKSGLVSDRAAADALAHAAADGGHLLDVSWDVPMATGAVDDPARGDQWYLDTIFAEQAWPTTTGTGVTVAVVDSGIDATHEDLTGQVLPGRTFLNGQQSGGAADDVGHGTLVGGTIAALANNGLGGTGVAPGAKLLPVKALGLEGFASDVAAGVMWAVDQGARIINISSGGPDEGRALDMAIQYAVDHDVLVVAAAGNEGSGAAPSFPAADPRVLAVGATDVDGGPAPFTSAGPYVDLAAPGVDIVGPVPGGYADADGTSFSAPIVSGVAALVRSAAPKASAAQVRAALLGGARDIEPSGPDNATGAGIVDALSALRLAGVPIAPASAPLPAAQRMAGATRYETAAAISASAFTPGVPNVVVATGEIFPDALAGGPAAAALGPGPVLLVTRDSVPPATAAEIQRLMPAHITILGGPLTVTPAVEQQLGALTGAPVRRISGLTRFDTAAAVSQAAFPNGASVAFIASGENFPDALGAGALGASFHGPVLLVTRGAVPQATISELDRLQPSDVVVVGGPNTISAAVASQLSAATGAAVERLWGADRFSTSVAASSRAFTTGSSMAYVAAGLSFPDALAAAPLAAVTNGPLILVPSGCVSDAVRGEVARLGLTRTVVLGGPASVGDSVIAGQPC